MRLRTRITLTIEFVTTLTIVLMSVLLALFALGRITLFYYQQGQMLNMLGQSNIEYALSLPDRAARWTATQAIVTGMAISELVRLADEDNLLSEEEMNGMLGRIVSESARVADTPPIDGIRVRGGDGRVIAQAGKMPDPADMPEPYRQALLALGPDSQKPIVTKLSSVSGMLPGGYALAVPTGEGSGAVEFCASEALAQAMREEFDVEDVMTRFLLNAEVDRVAIVNANGEVEASAGESRFPDQPIADSEVVQFCVNFLSEHERRNIMHRQGNTSAPPSDLPFSDFLEVDSEDGNLGLGVVTMLDSAPGGPPRSLYIQHRTAGMVGMIQGSMRNLVLFALIVIVFAGIAGVMLSRGLAGPLMRLATAAQAIAAGNFHYRVPEKGDREIRILAKAFNQMADSLQRYTSELKEETQKRERLESDMRIGAEIQRALLPVGAPDVHGVEVIGWSEPAREVGGDFFDYLKLDDHRLGLALGDASGKGLPAAILITECSSIIRALAVERHVLGQLMAKTNNALVPRLSEAGHFVTLFMAEVNAKRGRLYYASAGHNPPLLVHADGKEPKWLKCDCGVPLGITSGGAYPNHEESFAPGDTLVIYSDGISDARNAKGEFYGRERLLAIASAQRKLPVPELIERIKTDVRQFMGGTESTDDMSLLVVRHI